MLPRARAELQDRQPTESKSDSVSVQTESVDYVVSSWLGLDTSDYSFGYIASWSNGGA